MPLSELFFVGKQMVKEEWQDEEALHLCTRERLIGGWEV